MGTLVGPGRRRSPRVSGGHRQALFHGEELVARESDGSFSAQASRAPTRALVSSWSERAYADARAYLAHRARVVTELGPRLEAEDLLLDLACGEDRKSTRLNSS